MRVPLHLIEALLVASVGAAACATPGIGSAGGAAAPGGVLRRPGQLAIATREGPAAVREAAAALRATPGTAARFTRRTGSAA